MFTIRPDPLDIICGSTEWTILTAPKKFASNCSLSSSIERLSTGPQTPKPALLTSASMRSNCEIQAGHDALHGLVRVGVELNAEQPDALFFRLVEQRLQPLQPACSCQ